MMTIKVDNNILKYKLYLALKMKNINCDFIYFFQLILAIIHLETQPRFNTYQIIQSHQIKSFLKLN